ncbi:MAG: arginase family protein [Micromonosporaceae bacterium]
MLAGIRAADPAERDHIDRSGIRHHGVAELEAAFRRLTGPVYVHLDLDVLDPGHFGSISYPEPDGALPEILIQLLGSLDNVVGAGITEYAPSGKPGDHDVIREIAAALRRSANRV